MHDKAVKADFAPLTDASLSKLLSAVDRALDIGTEEHVTMIATFCSNVVFTPEAFHSLIGFLETHSDVKAITSKDAGCVTILTKDGFVVTLRFIGSTKFMVKAADQTKADDSFEEVEELTQKVHAIVKSTPRK